MKNNHTNDLDIKSPLKILWHYVYGFFYLNVVEHTHLHCSWLTYINMSHFLTIIIKKTSNTFNQTIVYHSIFHLM